MKRKARSYRHITSRLKNCFPVERSLPSSRRFSMKHSATDDSTHFFGRGFGSFLRSSSSFARRRWRGLSPLSPSRSASALANASGEITLPRKRLRQASVTSRSSNMHLVENYHSLKKRSGYVVADIVSRQNGDKI